MKDIVRIKQRKRTSNEKPTWSDFLILDSHSPETYPLTHNPNDRISNKHYHDLCLEGNIAVLIPHFHIE